MGLQSSSVTYAWHQCHAIPHLSSAVRSKRGVHGAVCARTKAHSDTKMNTYIYIINISHLKHPRGHREGLTVVVDPKGGFVEQHTTWTQAGG